MGFDSAIDVPRSWKLGFSYSPRKAASSALRHVETQWRAASWIGFLLLLEQRKPSSTVDEECAIPLSSGRNLIVSKFPQPPHDRFDQAPARGHSSWWFIMYELPNCDPCPWIGLYGMYHQYHAVESNDGLIQPHGGILPKCTDVLCMSLSKSFLLISEYFFLRMCIFAVSYSLELYLLIWLQKSWISSTFIFRKLRRQIRSL